MLLYRRPPNSKTNKDLPVMGLNLLDGVFSRLKSRSRRCTLRGFVTNQLSTFNTNGMSPDISLSNESKAVTT